MKMCDMKMPKKETGEKKMMDTMPGSPSRDEYPYGLRINLGNDELKKLTISGDVGDGVVIHAVGTIISKRENEQQGGKSDKNIEIQIKELFIESKSGIDEMDMESYSEHRKKK